MSGAGAPSADWTPLGIEGFIERNGPLFIASGLALGEAEPVRLGMRVTEAHCNQFGFCHGGMLATFVDMALGVSVREGLKLGAANPTISLTVDFLGMVEVGDWLESRSRLVNATFRTASCDVVVLGPKGPVARANGLFKITRPKE
jgi:uncharacterized protein (TIGR00369 family)